MKYSGLDLFKAMKGEIFLKHIKDHLKEEQEVICKICNKSAETIAEEELVVIFDALKPLTERLRKYHEKCV